MTINLIPGVGTDNIRLGFSREEVHKILGTPTSTRLRNKFEQNTYDFYKRIGVFCYYNITNSLDGIEFSPDADIYFYGHSIFTMNAGALLNLLSKYSAHIEENDVGFSAKDLGISFSCEDPQDKQESPIEAVLIESPIK